MFDGDFRNWVNASNVQVPIYDLTTQVTAANGTVTRQVFANNMVPKALFDPTVVKALSTFRSGTIPTPERTGHTTVNVDFFNVFNHPNNPTGVAGNGVLSTQNSGSGARLTQLAARLTW